MSSEDVGPVVRRMRRGAGMTLEQLARGTGLSQSFLSQFERGRTQASISSLRLITDALGMNMNDVFDMSATGYTSLVREDDRPSLPFGDRARKTIVSARGLSRFEVFEVSFEVGGSTGPERYAHGNHEEMLLVTRGSLGLELGDDRHLLEIHDSISFLSSVPHRVANAGGSEARVLWIVSPPAYAHAVDSVPPRPGPPGSDTGPTDLFDPIHPHQ
ncbi:helix-turn-helix domain-containing protein [Leucobacter sp.]